MDGKFFVLLFRTDRPRVLEARSLYADPQPLRRSEPLRPLGMLRAIYWHSRLPGFEPGTAPVAARFVEVPWHLALTWIAAFDGIAVTPQRAHDSEAPTRTLRIEWNYVSSAFEVVWQGGELEGSTLSPIWQRVWNDMGTPLGTLPQARDVEEDWRLDLSQFDAPPFTTSRTSDATSSQLDSYPPLGQLDADSSRPAGS